MGKIVLAAYRPKKGKEASLEELLSAHVPILRSLGLVTEHSAFVGKDASGNYLEVFEWASDAAIEEAHHHPDVQALWKRFETYCEFIPPSTLEGFDKCFPNFERVI
jgi:quinol monooxygenase YgiN